MFSYRLGAAALLGLILTLGASAAASAEDQRFAGVVRGGVTMTGNTLGLSKALGLNEPGTRDSIGTFIAAGTGQDGNYPVGTTADWTQNESSAQLALPPGAAVVYAELVWGGSYKYAPEDVSAFLGTSVSLRFGQDTLAVAPDPLTATTIDVLSAGGFMAEYYARSADVTDFVAARGAGTYRVGGVPATQADAINSLNAAGWTMTVVYRTPAGLSRWVDLEVGGSYVDEASQFDVHFTGFCAPAAGPVAGHLLSSAIEGDANLVGDQLLASADGISFANLSGPNNPSSNFFASQINDAAGVLDTSGSFGAANHDAGTGTNVLGGRQGWDLTRVAVPGAKLANSQQGLFVRALTTGDTFLPTLLALDLPVDAPSFSAGAGSLGPNPIEVGQKTTLTVPLANSGPVAATGVLVNLPLPAGVGLDSFAIDGVAGDSHGDPVSAAELAGAGADVGNIPSGATRTLTIVLSGDAAGSFGLAPSWDYAFKHCPSAADADDSQAGTQHTLTVTSPAATSPNEQQGGPNNRVGETARSDAQPPETTIAKGPKGRLNKRRVTLTFSASEAGSRFECKLDKRPFDVCLSPLGFKVKPGPHTFQVRATDPAGNVDPTPAIARFKVVKQTRRGHRK